VWKKGRREEEGKEEVKDFCEKRGGKKGRCEELKESGDEKKKRGAK
jgi:hypothetical protein